MTDKQTEEPSEQGETCRFPIVGIGASAGGFDALHRMLQAMPDEPDVAIVIVQHLAADKPSLAAEVLARSTTMEVRQVHDEPLIERNCIYVIPPGKHLSIAACRLRLSSIESPHGAPITIDYFFRALAKGPTRMCRGYHPLGHRQRWNFGNQGDQGGRWFRHRPGDQHGRI